MKKLILKYAQTALIILSILLFFGILIVNNQLNEQKSLLSNCTLEKDSVIADNSGLQASIQEKNAENQGLLTDLTSQTNEFNTCNVNLEDCSTKTQQQEEQLQEVLNEISSYEYQINESMSWFRTNSNLYDQRGYDQLRLVMKNHCLEIEENTCTIKMPKIPFYNEYQGGIKYLVDFKTSGKTDFLQTLNQIMVNQGGDCEDLALLFSAELNYLAEECKKDGKTVSLGAMKAEKDYFYEINEDWIYRDFRENILPAEYRFWYTVCGYLPTYYDQFNSLDLSENGHCVTAFTKIEINPETDIYAALKESILVEPQDGRLLANMNEIDFIIIPQQGKTEISEGDFYLNTIITGEDLYQYDSESKEWKSNAYFYDRLVELAQNLG